MSILALNLDSSRQVVLRGQECHFWLNEDGTVSSKSWIGRLIRWIQNFIFNTTIVNIVSVFEKSVVEYLRLRNDSLYQIGLVTVPELNLQARRVMFAAGFVASRIDRLNTSTPLKWKVERLLNQIAPSQAPLVTRLETLSIETTATPRIAQIRLEDLELIPLSTQVLQRRGPAWNIAQLPLLQIDITSLPLIYSNIYDTIRPPERGFFSWVSSIFGPASEKSKTQAELARLCKAIVDQDPTVPSINPNARPHFYGQLRRLMVNIIPLLCEETIPAERKLTYLTNLAEAVPFCGPRWLEEVEILYRSLTNQELTPVNRVLLWKQHFIENLIRENLRNSRHTVNALNWVRLHWGELLGIEQHGASFDRNLEPYPFPIEELKAHLVQSWRRIVPVLKEVMGNRIDSEISHYLSQQIEGISNPEEFVLEEYYSSGRINDRGVHRLLRQVFS